MLSYQYRDSQYNDNDCLVFMMGIPISEKTVLTLKKGHGLNDKLSILYKKTSNILSCEVIALVDISIRVIFAHE